MAGTTSDDLGSCIVCGRPGVTISFPSVGGWTSDPAHGVSVCPDHNPRCGPGDAEYDLTRAKIVAEAIQLNREGRTRRPES